MVTEQEVEAIGRSLVDPQQPLQARFRALFTLRGLGGPAAIAWISRAFNDDSALLKHELAYCLGQLQDPRAVPVLVDVLRDTRQEPMVRHEAGEALGAIGSPEVLEVLKEFEADPVVEVAETCQLAVRRLEWLQQRGGAPAPKGPYLSVDPAPPAEERNVGRLRAALLDEARPLFDRYRAMFALRDTGGEEAALALAEGLRCGSALFRHEVGYVLGQLQHEAAVPALAAALARRREPRWCGTSAPRRWGPSPGPACLAALRAHTAGDPERVVRESCAVALDLYAHESARPSSTRTAWSACARRPPTPTPASRPPAPGAVRWPRPGCFGLLSAQRSQAPGARLRSLQCSRGAGCRLGGHLGGGAGLRGGGSAAQSL
uniref:Deoxyhypusine hydroxylase n=1 Tax=Equus asinus TaxID=9793 RepID=A0A8C4N278_EQUAS